MFVYYFSFVWLEKQISPAPLTPHRSDPLHFQVRSAPACIFFFFPPFCRRWKRVEEANRKICLPQNKNNHFNCNGCVWGAAAVAGSPGLRWHRPPLVGRGGGGDKVVGRPPGKLQGGAARQPPLPAVSPESCSPASSSPFHLWPLEIIGDALSVNMFLFLLFFSLSLSSIFTPDQSCILLLQAEVLRRWVGMQKGEKKRSYSLHFNILKVKTNLSFFSPVVLLLSFSL